MNSTPRTTKDFLVFVLKRILAKKKWWMLPLWAVLVALGLVLYLSGGGSLLPAIYLAF